MALESSELLVQGWLGEEGCCWVLGVLLIRLQLGPGSTSKLNSSWCCVKTGSHKWLYSAFSVGPQQLLSRVQERLEKQSLIPRQLTSTAVPRHTQEVGMPGALPMSLLEGEFRGLDQIRPCGLSASRSREPGRVGSPAGQRVSASSITCPFI